MLHGAKLKAALAKVKPIKRDGGRMGDEEQSLWMIPMLSFQSPF